MSAYNTLRLLRQHFRTCDGLAFMKSEMNITAVSVLCSSVLVIYAEGTMSL